MCFISEPQIKNLVFHFRVSEKSRTKLKEFENDKRVNKKRNFFVFKIRKPGIHLSYTVFPQKGSVIATGVKSVRDINSTLQNFADIIKIELKSLHNTKIVNSTYTGSVVCSENISTYHLLRHSNSEKYTEVNISFRSQFFPGVLIKWDQYQGSVNLFNNGQYVLVGVKSKTQANVLYNQLCALIQKCSMTSTQPTSCVWTAVSSSTECMDTSLAAVNANAFKQKNL